jgi:hypothetical protein
LESTDTGQRDAEGAHDLACKIQKRDDKHYS